jgi:putative transposase
MYDYRTMTPEQRRAVVEERRKRGFPWHGPPHPEAPGAFRIVTAACYEHRKVLNSTKRLEWFERELLHVLRDAALSCAAWCVLPNHYHVLVQVADIRTFARLLGQLHGRTAFTMNDEDGARGRKVWYRCQDRCMRSEGHFYASLNYIHNNPVRHGYVVKWQDWPFSSAHWYLDTRGRDWLVRIWQAYPPLNYGATWDTF